MAASSAMTGTRTVWWSVVLLSLLAVETRAAEPQRVLMLHAFGHAYSPWSDIAASFRAEIIKRSPQPINLYEVSLDTTRAPDTSGDAPFIEYIRALLSGQPPDLIVPVGAPAAFFLQRNRAQLFPRTPMLILGADIRRIPDATRTEYDTGVLLDLDLPAYVANVLQLLPQTKNLAVVVGNSPVERYWASELRRAFGQFEDRVNIIWFNDLTLSEMQERAARMPAQSVIFWFLLSEDAAGVPYSEDRALEAMREVAAVPIFGMGDYQLGRGIVGGPLMQTKTLGQRGADVALRILRGDKPSALDPPSVLFGPPAYDSRELRRWGISEARLPHDSVVHFRTSDVIVAGDIFSTTSYPFIDIKNGGSLQGEIQALNFILDKTVYVHDEDGGTMIIPGHGRVTDEWEVTEYRDMLVIIRDRVQALIKQSATLDQVKAARVTADYDDRYGAANGSWTTDMFVEAVYKSLKTSPATAARK